MNLVSCPNCEQLPGDRINYVIALLLLLVILLVVITMQLGQLAPHRTVIEQQIM